MNLRQLTSYRQWSGLETVTVSCGHDPEGFTDEEMVRRICLNKDDLDTWFN